MNSSLSPREIQSRLRAGASVPEVAAEAGVEVSRIEGFALPVLAERAHMTRTALASSVRRRGDGSGHRRLGEIIRERLQARSLDADTVEWDSWRQNDLKWRVVGLLDDQAASRAAEFVFDPHGRFSVADNPDARWMIGETLPGPQTDPDDENTIDFQDELALVRAISDSPSTSGKPTGRPGDDVPHHGSQYGGASHTSELDELYDMLSGVSEDSVRIYLGLDDAEATESVEDSTGEGSDDEVTEVMSGDGLAGSSEPNEPEATLADKLSEHPELAGASEGDASVENAVGDDGPGSTTSATSTDSAPRNKTADSPDEPAAADPSGQSPASDVSGEAGTSTVEASHDAPPASSPAAPEQDPLVPDVAPAAPKRQPAKKRASIPSWDEIMFGGPTPN